MTDDWPVIETVLRMWREMSMYMIYSLQTQFEVQWAYSGHLVNLQGHCPWTACHQQCTLQQHCGKVQCTFSGYIQWIHCIYTVCTLQSTVHTAATLIRWGFCAVWAQCTLPSAACQKCMHSSHCRHSVLLCTASEMGHSSSSEEFLFWTSVYQVTPLCIFLAKPNSNIQLGCSSESSGGEYTCLEYIFL